MATAKETVAFILDALGDNQSFTTRAMFGEYALYSDGKVVALICNDQLYVKIAPETDALEKVCERDCPYPGSRLHYLVEEHQLCKINTLPAILRALADTLKPPQRKRNPQDSKFFVSNLDSSVSRLAIL